MSIEVLHSRDDALTELKAIGCLVALFRQRLTKLPDPPCWEMGRLILDIKVDCDRMLDHRILTCPECREPFYRVRKQKYCSRLCANNASVKRYRQKVKKNGRRALCQP